MFPSLRLFPPFPMYADAGLVAYILVCHKRYAVYPIPPNFSSSLGSPLFFFDSSGPTFGIANCSVYGMLGFDAENSRWSIWRDAFDDVSQVCFERSEPHLGVSDFCRWSALIRILRPRIPIVRGVQVKSRYAIRLVLRVVPPIILCVTIHMFVMNIGGFGFILFTKAYAIKERGVALFGIWLSSPVQKLYRHSEHLFVRSLDDPIFLH